MPRVNLMYDRYRKLKLILNGYFSVENKTHGQLRRLLDVGARTIYRYLNSPAKMQLEKLLKTARNLNIPIGELRQSMQY